MSMYHPMLASNTRCQHLYGKTAWASAFRYFSL